MTKRRRNPVHSGEARVALVAHAYTVDRLTCDMWSALIDDWNQLQGDGCMKDGTPKPRLRLARLTQCRDEGHSEAETPLSDDDERVYMCRRCCAYRRVANGPY